MAGPDRPQVHVEPFLHLVDITHERALIAWGAFWFERTGGDPRWRIVDDQRLPAVARGRRGCIGAGAEPYGAAEVQVLDAAGAVVARAATSERSWVWVEGLEPDTEYRYRVLVDGREWGAGERWDWTPDDAGGYSLKPAGRGYDLRLKTDPDPKAHVGLTFAAIGDYGVGICSDSESSRRQRRVAEALEHLVVACGARLVLSLGDNVYLGEEGRVDDESGGEDDDWYSSFYQPYRYVISRVPVFPAIGNHDTTDTEGSDDRTQMEDNFHTAERFRDDDARASVSPGLFYRFGYGADVEFVCVDTSLASPDEHVHRFFQDPKHLRWLEETFARPAPRWRIPFSHHPAYCAGPEHGNDPEILDVLVPLFAAGGVRLVLAGHEHNFQLSRADGRTYVVSGAGGKLRERLPHDFAAARTQAWAMQAHVLLVELGADGARLTPVSGLRADGSPHLMTALTPHNDVLRPPFVVTP
jgi:tartrate-resistant acid phosphatase type 5